MTIYFNAKIFTFDGIKSWMRVENGKIIELGTGKVELSDNSTDMKQQTILGLSGDLIIKTQSRAEGPACYNSLQHRS